MFFSIRTCFLSICVIFILFTVIGGAAARKPIRKSRIVGGEKTTIDKVPYIVQIRDYNDRAFCGGTLITSKYVITAAHCVDGMDINTLTVVGGASTVREKGVQSKITKATMHHAYKDENFHSDIAVVELASELKGENIAPAPLCKQTLKVGDFIQASGWGRLNHSVPGMARDLHTVRLPFASHKDCEETYGDEVKTNIFCASGVEPKGVCRGDSGGPAVFKGQLCGVNAFTVGCGENKEMSGFIDINRVRDFIDKVMGPNALKN